jgi:imidazole glycerol phosphate synthase subunit HisF
MKGRQLISEVIFSREVRRLLTSIADSEINIIEHDTYVPNGILPFNESFALIQEGADNVDINTETIDEKDTFHRWQELITK